MTLNLDEIKQFIADNREIAQVQAQRWQGVDPSRMLAALEYLEQVIAAYTNTERSRDELEDAIDILKDDPHVYDRQPKQYTEEQVNAVMRVWSDAITKANNAIQKLERSLSVIESYGVVPVRTQPKPASEEEIKRMQDVWRQRRQALLPSPMPGAAFIDDESQDVWRNKQLTRVEWAGSDNANPAADVRRMLEDQRVKEEQFRKAGLGFNCFRLSESPFDLWHALEEEATHDSIWHESLDKTAEDEDESRWKPLRDRRESARQMIDAHNEACRTQQIVIEATLDGLYTLFKHNYYDVCLVHHEDNTQSLVVDAIIYIHRDTVRPSMSVDEYRQWRVAVQDVPYGHTWPIYSYKERL